ncbi:MAG: DinB family protein [Trueperaceae bacterium]
MDPYLARIAGLLGNRDPIRVLAATPVRLDGYAETLPSERWDVPWRPGGWSPRQIVAHLCDQEIGFGFRARQTVAAQARAERMADGATVPTIDAHTPEGTAHVAQPYDQDAWARAYPRLDPTVAIQGFSGLRAWNLAWLARLELNDWLATYHHPERGADETVDELVRFLAGHDLNHLTQLDVVARG